MRLLSLFSGIGAFEKALDNIGIGYELVNYCEIDKFASKAYSLIHNVPESKNLGDIRTVDTSQLKDIDMITYGFPCVDISLSGRMRGFEHEGEQTRSGLFFEALRIIEDTKPAYAVCENVKNLVSKRFTKEFNIVLSSLEKAGYNNYWKVLNAKDFGIPQNRERVFVISIRKDIDDGKLEFPEPKVLSLRLRNLLEDEVDERYYMSEKSISYICSHGTKSFSYKPEIDLEVARPLTATMHKSHRASQDNYVSEVFTKHDIKVDIKDGKPTVDHDSIVVRENTKRGFTEANEGDSINFEMPNSKTRRGRVGRGVAHTLDTGTFQGVVVKEPFIVASRGRYVDGGKIEQRLEPNFRGVSNTLTTVQKDNLVCDPRIHVIGNYSPSGHDASRIVHGCGLAPTVKENHGTVTAVLEEPKLRIRKLTPKECFRLMGFDDRDIDVLIENGISNTQLYKMAGNSIVVDVLEAIFANLTEREENNVQMS